MIFRKSILSLPASSDLRRKTRLIAWARRTGFTIVELLVSLGIVTILLALLLAGVHAARESARRGQCQNNLKQVGQGFQNHVAIFKVFPSNGGYDGKSSILSTIGVPVTVSTYDNELGRLFEWGVGSPGSSPSHQAGSWAYSVLPYLEQQNAYENVEFRTIQIVFLCPSRGRPSPEAPIKDSFGRYESGGWSWAKTDYAANLLLVKNRPKAMSPATITDGLSNTILVGEKAFDRIIHTATTWYWDEPIFTGGSQGTARDGGAIVPDGSQYEFKTNWGAAHKVIHFVRADGSVQAESFSIDWRVFDALRSPSMGD